MTPLWGFNHSPYLASGEILRETQDAYEMGARVSRTGAGGGSLDSNSQNAIRVAQSVGFTEFILIVGFTMASPPNQTTYNNALVAWARAYPRAYLELGNELLLNGWTLAQLAAFMRSAYSALRAAGCSNKVLMACATDADPGGQLDPNGDELNSINYCKYPRDHDAGIGRGFDYPNYHNYGVPSVIEASWSHFWTPNYYGESCQSVLGHPPFAMTEWNQPVQAAGSEAAQADAVTAWMNELDTADGGRCVLATIYAVTDKAIGTEGQLPDGGWGYGTTRIDLSRRPAFAAYQDIALAGGPTPPPPPPPPPPPDPPPPPPTPPPGGTSGGVIAADGLAPAVAFPGGLVVVRAAEFFVGARGSLTVNNPDAQATSGESVEDSQTAANLTAADDTLSIPFSALPLRFGLDYRIQIFYRCTGTGTDDHMQRLTDRRVFAWGFKTFGGTVRSRSDTSPNGALKKTLLAVPRPWFGVLDLAAAGDFDAERLDFAYRVAADETLDLAVFKTAGTGAVIIDQVVFVPAQTEFTDADRIFDDEQASAYLGWNAPYPDQVTNTHDETDMHQGGSIACYARGAAAAAPLEVDPATLDEDFRLDTRYDAYVLAAVHLPETATLVEDHFGRTRYPSWGTGDTGDTWHHTTTPELLAAVLETSDVPAQCVPKGVWDPLRTYSIDDLVEGSDTSAYISVYDEHAPGHTTNEGNDPTIDDGTFWRLAAADGDAAFLFAHGGRGSVTTEWFGDVRVTVCASTPWVLFNDSGTNSVPVKWSPWSVVIHDGTVSPNTLARHLAQAVIDESGNLFLRITRVAPSGGQVGLSSLFPISAPYAALDRYWTVFQKVGAELKAKMWRDGTTEPDWQVEVTDQTANVPGVGNPGTGQLGYLYGRAGLHVGEYGDGVSDGLPAGLSFTRDSDGSTYGYVRFDDFKVEAVGGAPEEGHVALTDTGTADVVLGPQPVPANRNWVWLHLGAALVWPSPGTAGLDIVAWSPESAPYWQAINGQASFWATHRRGLRLKSRTRIVAP